MKALARGLGPVLQSFYEALRDVVCVHVMQGFATDVRQRNFTARGEIPENLWVEVSRGV
jgi:hypothetical protein